MSIVKANSNNDGAQWWIAGNITDLTLSHNPAFKVGDFAEIKPSDAPNAYKVYVYTGQNLVAPLGWELWGTKGGGGGDATASFYPSGLLAGLGSFSQGFPVTAPLSTTVDRSGYNDIINVKATGLPSGLSIADFSISSTSNTGNLSLVYNGTTAVGTYPFTLSYYKNGSLVVFTTTAQSVTIASGEA